jgi:hypothetical protein
MRRSDRQDLAVLASVFALALFLGCQAEAPDALERGDALAPIEDPAPGAATPDESDEIDLLSAIGYVSGSDPVGSSTGVTQFEEEYTYPGLNLLTSAHGPVAQLMDLEGNVLHEWRAEFDIVFPYHPRMTTTIDAKQNFWRDAALLPDGSIIVIWDLYGIFKLDRDSKVLWVVSEPAHHDLQVMEDGSIYHLQGKRRLLPEIPEDLSVEDFIIRRDADGVELSRVSIAKALRNADWMALRNAFWEREGERQTGLKKRSLYDPFHTNSLRILSETEAARLGDPFQVGDALVSMAMLDTIAIIDMEKKSARWWQQGPFGMQHKPRVTQDGRVVLFNNYLSSDRSSVQVLDVHSREVVWEFTGSESEPLYSKRSGSVEALPNGNILIVETDRGRVLEVRPNREVVWEYRNPNVSIEDDDLVAHIYSMDRLDRSGVSWLERPLE